MLNAMGMIENKLRLPLVPTRITTFEAMRTILNELKELDLGQMTPIEAMNKLYELQNKVKNRW